jgi:hypothetical protein
MFHCWIQTILFCYRKLCMFQAVSVTQSFIISSFLQIKEVGQSSGPIMSISPTNHATSKQPNQICRFCLENGSISDDGKSDSMVVPCQCNGSIKYVHTQCLAQWMTHNNRREKCNLCSSSYSGIQYFKQEKGFLSFIRESPLWWKYLIELVTECAIVVLAFAIIIKVLVPNLIVSTHSDDKRYKTVLSMLFFMYGLCIASVLFMMALSFSSMWMTFQRWKILHFRIVILPQIKTTDKDEKQRNGRKRKHK